MDNNTELNVLSIDAWRDGGGWQWNNWFKVGKVTADALDLSPRKLLAKMRDDGYLAPTSTGKVAIDDDGYNVVIVARGTREPLFAIEYGCHI